MCEINLLSAEGASVDREEGGSQRGRAVRHTHQRSYTIMCMGVESFAEEKIGRDLKFFRVDVT